MARALSRSRRLVDVEMNYSGQFAGLLREKTGLYPDHLVVKYNGRPMSCEEVYGALRLLAFPPRPDGPAPKKLVLRRGA